MFISYTALEIISDFFIIIIWILWEFFDTSFDW